MEKTVLAVFVLVGVVLLAGIAYLALPATATLPNEKVAIMIPIIDNTPEAPQPQSIGITAMSPSNLAKHQDTGNNILVTFTETMDPTTVNQNTFIVQGPNGMKIKGVITPDATKKSWTFNPTGPLAFNSMYRVTITTGVRGTSGNALVKNGVWSFTTSPASSGSTSSTQTSDDNSGSSSQSAQRYRASSSNSNPGSTSPSASSPSSSNFGSTPSSASSSGSNADQNPVPEPTPSAGPAAVNLGTASSFVILSKAGISTTGTTAIIGDIGVSPIDSTAITGFGLVLDPTTQFSTSSLVTGSVYAADYTSPTPAKMTTAISNMETAFTNAAGRTNPTATELGAGDLSGRTLNPGLYKWSTGVMINTAVTLDCKGNANAVFIFQIAQDLTVGNGAAVTLSSGCQAKNLFWQVSGQATLGTTSHFKGNILSQTLIEMKTGATLDGRALAQTAVTLDANSVTIAN